MLPVKKNTQAMTELVAFSGKQIVDVGCGDGTNTRFMAEQGGHVTGVECGELPLAKARAANPVADERYLEGRGENLPLDSGWADLVLFFNSLHHIPSEAMDDAIGEAWRVLAPGGQLLINEPIADGAFFELVRPIDDETEVRAQAYDRIMQAGRHGFVHEAENSYAIERCFSEVSEFKERMITVDASRRAKVEAAEKELAEMFLRLGDPRDGIYCFIQPMRINLLRKPS